MPVYVWAYIQEIPAKSKCQSCKNEVERHELRQCSSKCGSGGLYCIRICGEEDCRTVNCTKPGHYTCWDLHLPRKEDKENPHNKVDPLHELYVSAVTYSETNEEKQQKLHEEDRIALWFTIRKESSREAMLLCLTDRFRQLCNPGISGSRWSLNQYPGFVSFIGDTGRGKSTLLRAMILMGSIDPTGTAYRTEVGEDEQMVEATRLKIEALRSVLATKNRGPVTRSAVLSHMTDPTSFGVHLYRDEPAAPMAQGEQGDPGDPAVIRDTPILFSDCEGFRAGLARTNAQRAYDDMPPLISDSPITAASYKENGKDGVDLFYARFLYAISDVVALVMSGDNMFFAEMQNLVEWAASAVYRSVNHVAHKTLIIIRNMGTPHREELYREATMRESLNKNLENLWKGSPILENFCKEFNSRTTQNVHQIRNNSDLLEKIFSDVRYCYIPDMAKAPSSEIFTQYQKLRHQIVYASRMSQERRSRVWMQYNVPTLSHILNRAFEHFRVSDEPFDFYMAGRNDNPNPESESDHIANFLRHLHSVSEKLPPQLHSAPSDMAAQVVSINLISWSLRRFNLFQEPEEIFRRDLEGKCKEAVRIFGERDQRCGFKFEGGQRCAKRGVAHGYEHYDENGNRIPGIFDQSLGLSENTVSDIRQAFIVLYHTVCTDNYGKYTWPDAERSRRLRKEVLEKYRHIWTFVRSNKSCLSCFQAVPDHVLECGHSFCAQCVQEFGVESRFFENGWVMNDCVLCLRSWNDRGNTYRLHPRCAGVRALALDGGGIRGIVEIVLLEKLHAEIGLGTPLRDYFDLIMATSTGGIISLGLATKELSIGDLKGEFLDLATKTFGKTKSGNIPSAFDPTKILMAVRIWDSLYPTTPLREGLQNLFGRDEYLFSAAYRPVRVAVTSSKDNGAEKCLITNYNRPKLSSDADYHSRSKSSGDTDFEREDESDKEMKIWEAALATSAAPFYFRKFVKPETKKDYTDGALHANFPVPYALEEIVRVWGGSGKENPSVDILISVGTGIQEREVKLPLVLKIGGFEAICTSFHANLNCEERWKKFEGVRANQSDIRGKVHRLNARITGKYVSLDDHKRMEGIISDVEKELKDPEAIKKLEVIGDALIASLFHFEPTVGPKDAATRSNRHQVLFGSIRCRLPRDSIQLKLLVDIIDSFWYAEAPTTPSPASRYSWTRVPLSRQLRHGARNQGQWLRIECSIAPSQAEGVLQVLAVSLRRPRRGTSTVTSPIPISGFPVSFQSLRRKAGLGVVA